MLPKGETTRHDLQWKIIIEDLGFAYHKHRCMSQLLYILLEGKAYTVSNTCFEMQDWFVIGKRC